MKNFNWNNYIGEHMVDQLWVKHNKYGNFRVFGCFAKYLLNWLQYEYLAKDCKPIIKSISDLTDEEVLWVLYGEEKAEERVTIRRRKFINIAIDNNEVLDYIYSCMGFFVNYQQILNRLYSLHVSLDYDELIKNDRAVRKP